jgi:Carboxypeptidase regulatory-like domain/TonB dependent receptor
MWLYRMPGVVAGFASSLILYFVFSAEHLQAQSTNASLAGRVTDPSNALIVGARVAAISVDTNIRYEGVTNSAGGFYLTNLLPGTYRIEIEKPGFKKLVRPSVFLHVQDALEIDLQMVLGSASETVTVQSGVPVIDAESTSVSTVIDRTYVENLPLNGRSLQTFLLLSPGVVLTATAFDDQGQFSVNGQRADANYFTVDGVSANFGVTGFAPLMQSAAGALPALSALGGTNSLASVDAVQEFRIQTSSFAPEFGRTPGGQVSILTRSGTNSFHGTLFDYFRNAVLDANNWFSNLHQLPKSQEQQNDFGGVFSGPIRKDKTFFFFSYEGLRLLQPSTKKTVVPDVASRQQASTAVQPYLNAYPVPNGASLGQGLAQFNAGYSNPSALDAVSIRADHNVNPKTALFGRYNYSPSSIDERAPGLSFGSVLSTTEFASYSAQTFTVGLTESINQTISNEIRANYSNNRAGIRYALDHFGGADPIPDSVLFPPGFSSANSSFTFTIVGAGQFADGSFGIDEQRQLNLVDNLSMIKASHQLKFGVDYRWLAPFSSRGPYGQLAEFSGMSTAPGGALSNPAAALVADSIAHQSDALLSQNFSLYAQDTWKFTPRLTLVYGLRWDVNPHLKGKNLANDPFTAEGLNNPSTMTLAPRGTPLYATTYGNVAPRLGLAYQLRERPDWGSVLRASGGIFYDLGSGSLGGVSSYFPYSATKVFSLAPFPLSPQDAAPPLLTVNPPVLNILVADPNLKLPRTYQWNIALEQSLGSRQSLSLTYVGAVGRDFLRSTVLNPVSAGNPNFNFVFLTDNSATSNYNALQLKFQRRSTKGLQALASYTFSHSIDISSTDAAFAYLDPPGSVLNPKIDRGNSDFDIRHSCTAGLVYDIPVLGTNKTVRNIFQGWSVTSFVMMRSGPPVDIVSAQISAGVGVFMPRPDIRLGVPLELEGPQYPGGKAFNPAAFVPAPRDQQGDLGRNVLRAFGAWQADLGLQRQFQLTEAVALRFRGEFFNLFNHPNFGSPNNVLSSPLFGQSTQTLANSLAGGNNAGFNPLYQIGGPRSIQLSLKLQF